MQEGMRQSGLSTNDLEQALRLQAGQTDPVKVKLAILERNGHVSVIPYEREPSIVELFVAEGVQTVRLELEFSRYRRLAALVWRILAAAMKFIAVFMAAYHSGLLPEKE